ncbi:UNVERIFIED_CONTAM: hypothetical protein Sradi_2038900 [Sesamum radiatum]|uniref:Uncharacterized protein n=1 Tax=Sesamum radiatum TaxID=300843 RepID=A0AAW2TK72_SESRA
MANSDNGGDDGSYEENSSLPLVVGPVIPPTDSATGAANAPALDLIVEAYILAPTLALDTTAGPIAMNPLFCEQL